MGLREGGPLCLKHSRSCFFAVFEGAQIGFRGLGFRVGV